MVGKDSIKKKIPLGVDLVCSLNLILIFLSLIFKLWQAPLITSFFSAVDIFLAMVMFAYHYIPLIVVSVLLIISTIFLLKGRKWARTLELVTVILIGISSIKALFILLIAFPLIYIIPVIGIIIYLSKNKNSKEFFAN